MGFRDVVVGWFGEAVARRIEAFVEGELFGDSMVMCPKCARPVAAAFISGRQECPVCGVKATDAMMIEALEARRRTALAAGSDAISEVEEIDRRLIMLRAKR
jgi:uncharacterized protein (UPF0212 family)